MKELCQRKCSCGSQCGLPQIHELMTNGKSKANGHWCRWYGCEYRPQGFHPHSGLGISEGYPNAWGEKLGK